MSVGFLFVANKQKFVDEAIISTKSIKQFSNLPIAIVCSKDLVTKELEIFFDIVIINEEINNYIYLSKIIGIQNSPFERTLFLDSDTFICSNIDYLFELLDFCDIATTQENSYHTINPEIEIKFKNIIPEFNSGVVLIKKNEITNKLLNDWFNFCIEKNIKNDMPGLREAVLKNFNQIKYLILPQEYNAHGFSSMLMLYGEVKIVHERLGKSWKTTTPHILNFEEALKFSQKINKYNYKRLFVPYIGIIPYSWNLNNLFFKIKKRLGIKRKSKNR